VGPGENNTYFHLVELGLSKNVFFMQGSVKFGLENPDLV
jgi:hypothetical protein